MEETKQVEIPEDLITDYAVAADALDRRRMLHYSPAFAMMLIERIGRAEDALRKLANEASGFLGMADRQTHGNTNMAVLKLRIDEARAVLE